jgi:hypothetical protein
MKLRASLRFAFTALLVAWSATCLFGQETDAENGGNDAAYSEDTCGILTGNLVLLSTTTHTHNGSGGNVGYTNDYSLSMRSITRDGNVADTSLTPLLSWQDEVFGWMTDNVLMADGCKVRKNQVAVYDSQSLLAEFEYKREALTVTPAFRRKILAGLAKGDSTLRYWDLQKLLSGAGAVDTGLLPALRVYALRDSIEKGFVDYSIDALGEFLREISDPAVKRTCKRLLDSLSAWKKAELPVWLADAKKVGRLLNPPVYPPLDSPTVFWKDSLLCVVQEDGARPRLMRTFDPRAGKWGGKARVEYPESGLYKMYEKNTGTYSMACPHATFCWSKNLGAISEDPCEGLECGPLLILDGQELGSVENRADLRKAGGSCAAGDGRLEFFGPGLVKDRGDSALAWDIFAGPLAYGTRKYAFDLGREYPVAVSPDQEWIAYARSGKEGKAIDLWIARLRYKP